MWNEPTTSSQAALFFPLKGKKKLGSSSPARNVMEKLADVMILSRDHTLQVDAFRWLRLNLMNLGSTSRLAKSEFFPGKDELTERLWPINPFQNLACNSWHICRVVGEGGREGCLVRLVVGSQL